MGSRSSCRASRRRATSCCKGLRQKEKVRQEEFQEEVVVQEKVKGMLLRSEYIMPTFRSFCLIYFCFTVEHCGNYIESCMLLSTTMHFGENAKDGDALLGCHRQRALFL